MRFMRGFGEQLLVQNALPPQSVTSATTTNGTVVNRATFMGMVWTANVEGLTGGTATLKLQHGTKSDGSDMADAKDVNGNTITFATFTTANSGNSVSNQLNVSLQGLNNYIRPALVTGAGVSAGVWSSDFILGGQDNQFDPPTGVPAVIQT